MKKIIITITFLLVAGFCFAQEIEYSKIEIGCLILGNLNSELIITSEKEYLKILKNRSSHSKCTSYALPKIDFNENILLGYIIRSGGCALPEYNLQIYQENDAVIFNLKIDKPGMCKMFIEHPIWVTIPKEYEKNIKFEIEK